MGLAHSMGLAWDGSDLYDIPTYKKDGYTMEEPWAWMDHKAPRRPHNVIDRPQLPDQDGLYESHGQKYEMKEWVKWEWDVYCKETCLVREEAKWCMRREGANGLKNCRALAQQYWDMTRMLKMNKRWEAIATTKEPVVKDVIHELNK